MADQPSLRPDIQAAADRMDNKVGAKREIRKLIEYLWEGEEVRHMTAGYYGGGTGLVVMTDRRLFFVKDGWTNKRTTDFPYDKISSVEWRSGMLTGTLTVFASGNKTEIGNMSKATGKVMADTIRERLASGPRYAPGTQAPPAPQPITPPPAPVAPAPPTQSSSQDDVFAALEKLGKLREAGVVTPEEFEAKKKELLDRI
ncbi:PH domain-containing protein [Actinomadura napierensis]|uniref:YokE-like PH domain-containing protein n=1 Tax=Actinomadura napierensis TaxID=267854 RepID=A0ABP5K5P8_9ACTN